MICDIDNIYIYINIWLYNIIHDINEIMKYDNHDMWYW